MAGPDMGNGRAAGSQFRDLLDVLEGTGEGKGVATVADITVMNHSASGPSVPCCWRPDSSA